MDSDEFESGYVQKPKIKVFWHFKLISISKWDDKPERIIVTKFKFKYLLGKKN